ncbi:response regulator receiver domain protein [Leptospira inadai serovar Lyme str. 10]|uniref:Response regulator receiver domain protein n=2 Tax=Leptospira inadai serovar Lyme TaxID=293084 RepID=V6HGX6_9LEPT|nr:response regulator [Leptospira inadai]EQA35065.1 response regulator receiver domain protein [Leptospira inadai serovar Lyme str. 10]PNV74174.1 two-component system response regulator [Leptospira inadai serovar Lyme]
MTYRSYKVLLAEDDETSADLLIHYLERFNFEVDHVVDGAAGELKLRKEDYDLILLDNQMPRMSGVNLVATMPEKNGNKPVIFLTSSNEKENVLSAASSGQLAAYLLKPIDPSSLLEKILNALRINSTSLVDKKEFPFSIQKISREGYGIGVRLIGCPYGKTAERIVQEISFVLKELPTPRKFFLELEEAFQYQKNASELLSNIVAKLVAKYEISPEDILIIDTV